MFVRFLKNEGIYRKYIKEYMSEKNYYRELNYNNMGVYDFFMLMQYDLSNVISDSFPWKGTDDGFRFWYNIHKKWANFYLYGKK